MSTKIVWEVQVLDELELCIEKYRDGLKEKSGKGVRFSETGPVGMVLVDAIFKVLKEQQSEIDFLKSKVK